MSVVRATQRGVALISAMIVVALATVIAATLFFDSAMTARRSAGSFSMEHAIQLAQGAEALAAYALDQDSSKNQDTAADGWAQPYGPVEVAPEVALEAQLSDEQAKFNLNTLLWKNGQQNEHAKAVFVKLLKLLEMEPRWADLLIDWMDPDTLTMSEGGEDSLYASQIPPHRTANALLASVSELQQLPGMNRELYLRLLPHVTALPPEANTVNICMADGLVLDALIAPDEKHGSEIEFSRMRPEELAASRAKGCFPPLTRFADMEQEVKDQMGESTRYLRLRTWVRIGTAQFALYSLMYRDESGAARPISRTFGTE